MWGNHKCPYVKHEQNLLKLHSIGINAIGHQDQAIDHKHYGGQHDATMIIWLVHIDHPNQHDACHNNWANHLEKRDQ